MHKEQYTQFAPALAAGHQNEEVVAGEFAYHGIEVERSHGKAPYDFKLPSGQLVEVKLDLRSQRTSNGCIEANSLARPVDFFIHTFCYARVYTHQEYQWLYNHGKIPSNGLGEQHYEGRYVSKLEMRNKGKFLDEFIKSLKQQQ